MLFKEVFGVVYLIVACELPFFSGADRDEIKLLDAPGSWVHIAKLVAERNLSWRELLAPAAVAAFEQGLELVLAEIERRTTLSKHIAAKREERLQANWRRVVSLVAVGDLVTLCGDRCKSLPTVLRTREPVPGTGGNKSRSRRFTVVSFDAKTRTITLVGGKQLIAVGYTRSKEKNFVKPFTVSHQELSARVVPLEEQDANTTEELVPIFNSEHPRAL